MQRIDLAMMSTTEGWDIVDQASWESFPASDPPGWGSFHAAPSATTCGSAHRKRAVRPRLNRQVAIAWLASVTFIAVSLVVAQRVMRRSR